MGMLGKLLFKSQFSYKIVTHAKFSFLFLLLGWFEIYKANQLKMRQLKATLNKQVQCFMGKLFHSGITKSNKTKLCANLENYH